MKILQQLLLSHTIVQVCTNDFGQQLLFPKTEYITRNPSLLNWTGKGKDHVPHLNQSSLHVSHVSHALPGRSSMSITRTYRRPGESSNKKIHNSFTSILHNTPSISTQSGTRHIMPIMLRNTNTNSVSSLPVTSYSMPFKSSRMNKEPKHSGRTDNMPNQSQNPLYRTHYGSLVNSDGPFAQHSTSQSTRQGKSFQFSDFSDNHDVKPSKNHKGTMQANITKHEVTTDRSNNYIKSSATIKPITYDYQSLSRDQVDSYVFSALPDGGIEIDHNNREPDDSVDDARTKHGAIRTNLITHPVPSNNLITHQNNIDTSHRDEEEMVDFHSPMLTRPGKEGTPGPFAPRFQVPRWEISDSEWEEEIKEGFVHSGLVPALLPSYPPGLVNINYGVHSCVHLGTQMQAQTTSNLPSRVSFPSEPHRIYSLIFLDVRRMSLTWLVTNIPGSDIRNGQTIAEYQPPAPMDSSTPSQYLAMAILQSKVINKSSLAGYRAKLCQYGPRDHFHLQHFMMDHGLEMVVAANYFVVDHDTYVDSIHRYCGQL